MLRIEHSTEDSTGVPTTEVTNLDPTVPPFLPKHEKVIHALVIFTSPKQQVFELISL